METISNFTSNFNEETMEKNPLNEVTTVISIRVPYRLKQILTDKAITMNLTPSYYAGHLLGKIIENLDEDKIKALEELLSRKDIIHQKEIEEVRNELKKASIAKIKAEEEAKNSEELLRAFKKETEAKQAMVSKLIAEAEKQKDIEAKKLTELKNELAKTKLYASKLQQDIDNMKDIISKTSDLIRKTAHEKLIIGVPEWLDTNLKKLKF